MIHESGDSEGKQKVGVDPSTTIITVMVAEDEEGKFTPIDVNGNPIGMTGEIDNIIFAITSANHSNTRRNPLPLYQRVMAILPQTD